MTLRPGTRLGPYEIVASIGAGGMGEVWRARDTRLDREARSISQLNHAHVCTLYDVGQQATAESGVPLHYLVMELLDGESLDSGPPAPLFDALMPSDVEWRQYCVSRDGSRFLVNRRVGGDAGHPIAFVQNRKAGLGR